MSKDSADKGRSFDLERLRELFEMMERHGVTEVNLQRGDEKWRLRRGDYQVAVPVAAVPGVVTAAGLPTPVPQAAGPVEPATPDDGTVTIDSPTVGTFYAAVSPDDSPFVKAGSNVEPDTTVCIVEAMKVFNNIPAEISGTIVAVLVNNGDPVEFGQPLFRVRPV